MADERNPMDAMFPPSDNPEYHRRKAADLERKAEAAERAIREQHPHMAGRTTRVRQNPPAAAAPTPAPRDFGVRVETPVSAPTPVPVAQPAPVAAPVLVQAPKIFGAQPISGHPILQKLRQDFGIDNIPVEKVDINGTVFTMRVLDNSSVTYALRVADSLSLVPRENALNLRTALTAFSVLAIDGTALWEIFEVGIETSQQVLVEGRVRPSFDPMNPPQNIRALGASMFMDWLNNSATSSLIDELWKAYTEKVDPKSSLGELLKRTDQAGGDQDNVPLL